ncbi:hypothetical protein GCM10027028_14490 [Streptomyces sundarbansensis]
MPKKTAHGARVFAEIGVISDVPVAETADCAMAEPPVGTRVPVVVPQTKVPGLTSRPGAGTQWRDRAGFSPDFRLTLVMVDVTIPPVRGRRHGRMGASRGTDALGGQGCGAPDAAGKAGT